MGLIYEPVGWKNGEAGGTPVNEDNLNKMEKGISECVRKINELDNDTTGIVSQAEHYAGNAEVSASDASGYANDASEYATSAVLARNDAREYAEEAKASAESAHTEYTEINAEVSQMKSDIVQYKQSGYLSDNIFNTYFENGDIDIKTGQLINSPNFARTVDFIPVKPNTEYTKSIIYNGEDRQYGSVVMYDENKTYIGYISDLSTFTTDSNVAFIKLSVYVQNIDLSKIKDVQIVEGSSVPEYVPSNSVLNRDKASNEVITDAWNSTTTYAVGSYCIYSNSLWKCLVQNRGQTPTEGTYWTKTSIDDELISLNGDISNLRFGVPYDGVDLTQKFAGEIANYSDEWAWIKARIQAGNFKGICVCDYIPITCSNGYILKAQIAGINTYTGYAEQQVGNHIDFICKELWNDPHVMNKVNYNNGNANSPSPFLASDLNYWLNSMSGNVPNSTSDPSVTTEVDYTTSGVLYYLPDKLKNQIITKRIMLPSRYTEGKVLTNDNLWVWQSTGKLWIPSEAEICGAPCWGNSGYGMGGFVQYPLFACNMNRAKLSCASKNRSSWWLLSAGAGGSTVFALVGRYGVCDRYDATATWMASPVCFRIG